jgi:hypothetical protein
VLPLNQLLQKRDQVGHLKFCLPGPVIISINNYSVSDCDGQQLDAPPKRKDEP